MTRCDAKTRTGRRCLRPAKWLERHETAEVERRLCDQHHEIKAVACYLAMHDGHPFSGWQTVDCL